MSIDANVPTTNEEAIQAWDGPLFERFSRYRELVTTGLGNHGEAALALFPPQAGQRVLDIGCGFGDTTQRIAGMVGPEGEAVGVDAAPKFIEASRKEAADAGVSNARFETVDVQSGELEGPYDMAFSRMGVMFFANPVQAVAEGVRVDPQAPGRGLLLAGLQVVDQRHRQADRTSLGGHARLIAINCQDVVDRDEAGDPPDGRVEGGVNLALAGLDGCLRIEHLRRG